MRRNPLRLLQILRASYWFIPSLMALLALLLGGLTVWLDVGPGSSWLDGLGWYQSAKADGAREVLSTVAGSMITVAGVVFSITIVALSYASSQYGPRVLTNFMGDRGNQVTLGTFIATFLYCLVVLRTIRGGDEAAFVPQIAVMVGLLLGVCSIIVLIYFIHHVPQSIHINNVVARIGRQLIEDVEKRFPLLIGDPSEPAPAAQDVRSALAQLEAHATMVQARSTGYVQAINGDALLRLARKCDLILKLRCRPGDYIHNGRTVIEAWPAARLGDGARAALEASYVTANGRTPNGDLDFLISELVEIAARALSPGVNDPITANTCLDWLGATMSELARRKMPSPYRGDTEGHVRIIAIPDDFREFVQRSFGRVRQYVAGDMNSAMHMIRALGDVAGDCATGEQLQILQEELAKLIALAADKLEAVSMDEVRERAVELEARLARLGAKPATTADIALRRTA